MGDRLLVPEAFQLVLEIVLARLKSVASGLKRSELHSQTGLTTEVLEGAIEKLRSNRQIQVEADKVTLARAVSGPADRDSQRKHVVATAYEGAGLAPSSVPEIAQQLRISEAEMRRLVTLLLREKVLIRMGDDDTFVYQEAVKNLAQRLAPQRGKMIDVATFKALTGLTRKHAIPLLELLDRERITRKQGDVRVVL